jgi:GT2 family glycosyltransferase
VPKLSIILPVLGRFEALEQSLVSVLENRPESCEVIVVLNEPYDDPYRLEGEVRFVMAPRGAGWVECANLGLRQSLSPYVHLLDCGTVVSEGWTVPALRHFEDPRVAAVAALVISGADPRHVSSAGVEYRPSGRRVLVDRGQPLPAEQAARPVLGACHAAAFYRKASLELLAGFDPTVGDALADVDLALRLRHAGFRAVCEPRSQVVERALPATPDAAFRRARASERLFWRAAPVAGLSSAMAVHLAIVAGELLVGLPTLKTIPTALGRLAAWFEMGNFRRHHAALEQQRLQAALAQARQMDLVSAAKDRTARHAARGSSRGELPKSHMQTGAPRPESVGKRRPK